MYERFEKEYASFFQGYWDYIRIDKNVRSASKQMERMMSALEKQVDELKSICLDEAKNSEQRTELGICIGFAKCAVQNIFSRLLFPTNQMQDGRVESAQIQDIRDYADWVGLAALWCYMKNKQRGNSDGSVILLLNMRDPGRQILVEYPDLTKEKPTMMETLLRERGGVLAIPASKSVTIGMSSIPALIDAIEFKVEGLRNEILAFGIELDLEKTELRPRPIALDDYCTFLRPYD